MPNRLSPGKPQPQRLKVPDGHTIRWVPNGQSSPKDTTDPNLIGPVEQAQLHVQRQRLEEGRGPAEPGEGFIPSGQGAHDAETQRYLDEQRVRFSEPA